MSEGSLSKLSSTEIARLSEVARTERRGDTIYVYDETGTKRYALSRSEVPTVGVHNSLELQGQTSGGTWHTMVGAYENDDNKGIIVEGIHRGLRDSRDTTSGLASSYNTLNNGKREQSFGFGYYGNNAIIADDLLSMRALVVSASELPRRIDIPATIERVVVNFLEGSFVPPALVLPGEGVQKRKSTGVRARLQSFQRRALGR